MGKTEIIFITAASLLLSSCAYRYEWTKHMMDGHRTGVTVAASDDVAAALGESDGTTYKAPNGKVFTSGTVPEVAGILIGSQAAMSRTREVIGRSVREMASHKPESELSDWAVDCIMKATASLTGKSIDVGVINFGGIRCAMPEGNIMVDDIESMFPFRNHLCCVTVRGRDLRALFEQLARTGVQPIGGARMVVRGHELSSVLVGGKPIDDDRLYNVATIDFLLDGGDGLKIARNSVALKLTDVKIMDVILSEVRRLTAEGKALEYHTDGRVVIEKEEGGK